MIAFAHPPTTNTSTAGWHYRSTAGHATTTTSATNDYRFADTDTSTHYYNGPCAPAPTPRLKRPIVVVYIGLPPPRWRPRNRRRPHQPQHRLAEATRTFDHSEPGGLRCPGWG